MKKVLLMIFALVLTFALVGCGKKIVEPEQNENEELSNNTSEIREEYTEEPDYFPDENLGTFGVTQVISLKENPTTGYTWLYKFLDETVAIVEGDEYIQNENAENLIGVGGVHTFRISGLKPGNTELTFRYMHSWEDESSAIETVTYKLEVNELKEIAVVSVSY